MENNELENESVNNVEVADQHEVVEDTINQVEETTQQEDTTENVVENTEQSAEDTAESNVEKAVQSKEDNKAARLARLQAEKEAEARIEKVRTEAFEQGKKQGRVDSLVGKENPYTGEIIKDQYDAQEYLDMYELDSKGQDPVAGYRELQKSRARAEAKKQIELDEQLKQQEWYKNDTKDFVDKYGEEKLTELTKDKDFDVFARGKVGTMPLAEIYESYKSFINKYQKKSIETAKQIVANSNATPGAINSAEPQEINWNNMSKEQFEQCLKKAKDGELK